MKIKTYFDSYIDILAEREFRLTAGARECLMKSPDPNLYAAALIVKEFSRIRYGHVGTERFSFEAWCTMLRRVPKKKTQIRLPSEVWFTAEQIYTDMYGSQNNLAGWRKKILVTKRYLAYLISHGLLMLSCDKSEVSK